MENILNKVFERHPIVHCITNYVTVNDVANVIIASGGSPIMSDDITEVEEIVNISDGLVINIGTLNKRTVESMILAGNVANKKGIPVIFDPVGAGASSFRNETVKRLLDEIEFSIIKGNSSEIKFMTGVSGKSRGVDVSFDDVISSDNIEGFISIAKKLSELTNATVVMSGEIDIVAKKDKAALIRNGHSMMAKITGSGCMLAGILGVYAAALPPPHCLRSPLVRHRRRRTSRSRSAGRRAWAEGRPPYHCSLSRQPALGCQAKRSG